MQEGDLREGDREGDEESVVTLRQPWRRRLYGVVFPGLSLHRGHQKFTQRQSVSILSALYASHIFSAWGDRMWQFLVYLLLATLYPGSLLLPAVFGLVLGLLVALLGTMIGDWVDRNRRMKVVWVSLLVQNGLVCLCAVVLALMFGLDLGICDNPSLPLFIFLSALTIILGATANLATVANTIAIEKDWIVVIADKNEDTLAVLNANMRRIDLVCKLAAPAVAGVILQFAGPLATTIVVALWNVISFFAELALVVVVYRRIPTLAVKAYRKPSSASFDVADKNDEEHEEGTGSGGREEGGQGEVEGEGGEGEGGKLQFFNDDDEECEEDELFHQHSPTRKRKSRRDSQQSRPCCSCLVSPYISIKDGWTIYVHQEVALAGIALATIYLTVLGFSGVTAAYLLTQGLPNAAIGVAQGVGAIVGVSGTFAYPFIRRKIGTVRTGMFGISAQLALLIFCAVSVLIPAERVSNQSDNYYSAHCPADNGTSNASNPTCDFPTTSTTLVQSVMPTSSQPLLTHSPTLLTLSPTLLTPSPVLPTPSHSGDGSGSESLFRSFREAKEDAENDLMSTSPAPLPTCEDLSWSLSRVAPLALMLLGIMGARFGLWIFDLSVQQLVQETVAEDARGVVGGVMNAMNSIMDMLHYVLVIAAPRPEHFKILTLISVAVVTLGAVLYAVYLRKVRGHFFHCSKYYKACVNGNTGQAGFRQVDQVGSDQNYLVNDSVDDDQL